MVVEQLEAIVERVSFHSEASGFCVLRTKVKGRRDLVTVIGTAAAISAGENIIAQGIWVNDKTHGLQFKADNLQTIAPTTLEGIEKYLGSGMVKGIGPHFAKKLVQVFAATVFTVIEQAPARLMEVEGIGEKRQKLILAGWAEQKAVRNIMVFLHTHGVSTARAVRIYKTYGETAINKVKENPYRLALDIYGIGFKTADLLAQRLGIAPDSLIRVQAGVCHVVQELCSNGHCAIPKSELITVTQELLSVPIASVEQALAAELQAEHLVADEIATILCIYPIALYQAEVKVAEYLKRLLPGALPWGQLNREKVLAWSEQQQKIQLSISQRQAIQTLLQHKVSIITGGPGVGKTTLVTTLLKILLAKELEVALAAPTGRAAKRLSESTGLPATTIHRLLEFDAKTLSFKHKLEYPLSADVVIIDEASMLDIVLLQHLLKAIPTKAALIFIGDRDQLPSVGSGAVLADLIASQRITTVQLTEIFRQAAHSHIIINAHRINQGQMPLANKLDSDFYVLYEEEIDNLQPVLLQTVAQRLPRYYHCDPIRDIQVLTPMNRGGLGGISLNIELQKLLNGQAEPSITRFGTRFAPGDKVIQRSNNYDKEIFNGDIGLVEQVDLEEQTVTVRFEQRLISYDSSEVDELSLAYAISIHKSQGSEFPIVVIPIATQHYTLLARNLLYTAVTRGKKLVVLIAQKKALAMAVRNNKAKQRLTKLAQRLQA